MDSAASTARPVQEILGFGFARLAHREAPGARLRFRHADPQIAERTGAILSVADGLLMPHGIVSGFPAVELFEDRWVCLIADGHPEVGEDLTLDDLSRLPWAVYQRPYDAPVNRQLSMLGIDPRVEVSVQAFQLLPAMVVGTRRVALIQERLARVLPAAAGVRVLPCPFDVVPVREALWWHPLHAQDAGHIWLRETAARVGRQMAEG